MINQFVKLVEAVNNVRKVDNSTKNKIAKEFTKVGVDGNGRFESIGKGLQAVFGVLSSFNIEPDMVLSADLFREDSGTRNLDIAYTNKEDSFSPIPITHTKVVFSWYKRSPYNYEIQVYLS